MDKDTRDYFFELMRSLDDDGKDALLCVMYGRLEGALWAPEFYATMLDYIQEFSDNV